MACLSSPGGAISAAMRPRDNTSTRSQMSASWSASELAHRTAVPRSAASRMARKMVRRAPTSTPCVGSSSSNRVGLSCSHFARMTFCWLPPLSADSNNSGRFGTTPKA